MKIVVTGANGQLGRCLQDCIGAIKSNAIFADSAILDITSANAVEEFLALHQPDYVINAAAYTAVDKAEQEPELAYEVNALGAANLAKATARIDIPLVHVSTDYVFDGNATAAYKPNDMTKPQSVYGNTKLAGEHLVVSNNPQHLIIRTAWVFSEYGNNFVKTMLRLGQELDEIKVVADQYGCPTYAGDLAQAILSLIELINITPDWNKFGTYHFCGDQATSWHGFTRAIVAEGQIQGLIAELPKLTAITSEQFITPVKRPEYSVLDCNDFPVPISNDWRASLKLVIKTLASNQ